MTESGIASIPQCKDDQSDFVAVSPYFSSKSLAEFCKSSPPQRRRPPGIANLPIGAVAVRSAGFSASSGLGPEREVGPDGNTAFKIALPTAILCVGIAVQKLAKGLPFPKSSAYKRNLFSNRKSVISPKRQAGFFLVRE
jgi:hypothetical protein